jgi:FAD/FMN-containing dehydrogenase
LHQLPKDNSGPDIARLAVGSEGTLGIITAVRLQLHQPRTVAWTALIPVSDLHHAISISRSVGQQLLAAEVIQTRAANEVAAAHNLGRLPTDTDWWLLLEGESDFPNIDLPETTIVSLQQSDTERLWKYRELQTIVIGNHVDVLKLDVSVGIEDLAEFIARVSSVAAAHDIDDDEMYFFGHVMDGNIHISLVGASGQRSAVSDAIIDVVVEFGGAVSAEHGIGQVKGKYLPLVRTGRELALFTEMRRAFDPAGIMNPHVLRQ